MSKFKRYSPLYNSALVVGVIFILACGPEFNDNYIPSYFMPQSGYTPAASQRYYFSPEFFYENDNYMWDYSDYSHHPDQNLEEWKKYGGVQISDSLAGLIIYKGTDDPQNPFYVALGKKPHAWNYLLLARSIEKAATAGSYRWEPTPADTAGMKKFFSMVQDSLKVVDDPFLKNKYAFQAVKLAHLLHYNDSCITLYDKYFGHRQDSSAMKWWSLSHKAGALLDKGDTAQAVYLFAQVFDHCIDKRQAAYMSLRMNNIRFVPEALKYCKNDQEKAAVYTLCAIQPWQDALPLMQALVKIDPNHPYLELIMGREINKNENDYYNDQMNSYYYYRMDTTGAYKARNKAINYFEKLGQFAQECTGNEKIKDKAFWNTALAYIDYVQGDYTKAQDALADANKLTTDNPTLTQQIQLQQLLLATAEAKKITPALEKKVLPMLAALNKHVDAYMRDMGFYQTNVMNAACKRLQAMYKTSDDNSANASGWWRCNQPKKKPVIRYAPAKALLLGMSPYFLYIPDTTSDTVLDNLIGFYSQSNPSTVDSLFMQLTDLNLNDFYLLKGRRALNKFQYGEAVAAWQHVADTFWQHEPFKTYLAANPFAGQIIDTHAPTKADTIRYTPYQFAMRMQQLSEKIKQYPKQAANYYYLLGCGAYNMSYYGNSWLLAKADWSGSDVPYAIEQPMKLADSINYFTTAKAKAYFESAMQHAGADTELDARACYMAAKCERNDFYVYCIKHDYWNIIYTNYYFALDESHTRKRDSIRNVLYALKNDKFSQYFHVLKDKYSSNNFTKEVIRECATYKAFVQGK